MRVVPVPAPSLRRLSRPSSPCGRGRALPHSQGRRVPSDRASPHVSPRAGCVTKGTGGGRATRGAVTWDPCRAGRSSAWSAAGPAPPAATSAEREGRGRTNG
ncbi:hypothetical protein PAHAL_1G310200 [Panicum hallii]|uniref:Uncharacterized protein n=1 Tax=Panicum hallii TaxID=206008 RepID=A0A2T8KWW7_9POAL|nr:hypothetical protein PAHAL_1G310200 [Panicum hallii]